MYVTPCGVVKLSCVSEEYTASIAELLLLSVHIDRTASNSAYRHPVARSITAVRWRSNGQSRASTQLLAILPLHLGVLRHIRHAETTCWS